MAIRLNGGLSITNYRIVVNTLINFSNLFLLCALPVPAMRIREATIMILKKLTDTQRRRDRKTVKLRLNMMDGFISIHDEILIFKSMVINNQFLFVVLITSFSYLIVILQYEFESLKVNRFNMF